MKPGHVLGKHGIWSSYSYAHCGGDFSDPIAKGFLDGIFVLDIDLTMRWRKWTYQVSHRMKLCCSSSDCLQPHRYPFLSSTCARPFLSPLPSISTTVPPATATKCPKTNRTTRLNEMTSCQRHAFISSRGNSLTPVSVTNYLKGNTALCRKEWHCADMSDLKKEKIQ